MIDDTCHDRTHSYCVVCGHSRPLKPRYRLVSATVDGLYYFVNVNTSGIQREHYSICRSEFWGRVA